jgi:hypothetical protein
MSVNLKPTWLCDICKDYRNKGASKECGSCGGRRKKARYVLQLGGALYVCHIYALKHTQLMSVMRAMPPGEKVMRVGYPSDADITLEVVRTIASRALAPAHTPGPPSQSPVADGKDEPVQGQSPPAKEDSLFQRVMDDGTKLAYDPRIGRFVPLDTVEYKKMDRMGEQSLSNSHNNSNNNIASPSKHMGVVSTDLNYVKFMAQEKRVMKKVVEETMALRLAAEGGAGLHVPSFRDCARKPCALCELSLPEPSLLGEISFKTVARWRADNNAPLPESDHRFANTELYNSAPLCLFCAQFFAGDIGGAMERSADEIKAERDVPKLFAPPGVFLADTTRVRPASSIAHSVEVSNLKARALRAGGGLSIGTSSSVSVLEVKAKTAISMGKVSVLVSSLLH